MNPVQSCMGGWCSKRGHCANYHASTSSEPEERLCPPGHDGMKMALVVSADAGDISAELKLEEEDDMKNWSTKEIMDLIAPYIVRPEGLSIQDLMKLTGLEKAAAGTNLMRKAEKCLIFGRRGSIAGKSTVRYWATKELADAFEFDLTRDGWRSGRKCEEGVSLGANRHERIKQHIHEHGPGTWREIGARMGESMEMVRRACEIMRNRQQLFTAPVRADNGYVYERFFLTADERDAWAAENPVRDKIKVQKPRAPAKPREKKAKRCAENEIAKAMPKKKVVKEIPKPPALQPGDPIYTPDQVQVCPSFRGRYEVDTKVIGGFGTRRIGEYDKPASGWVSAMMAS